MRSDVVGTDYMKLIDDDDDVYYYIGERLKLEGETENMGRDATQTRGVRVREWVMMFRGVKREKG